MRFFASGFFFMNHLPPKPLKITVESFHIFSKIREDIYKSRCTTVINHTVGKFKASSTSSVANFPLVSTTPAVNFATGKLVLIPVANLPPVSTIPASTNPVYRWQKIGEQFST